jgi:hypothetical protein
VRSLIPLLLRAALLALTRVRLPVLIERILGNARSYQYTVRSAGGGMMVNAASQEKLRRDFDVVLPDLEDGNTVASYIGRVPQILTN